MKKYIIIAFCLLVIGGLFFYSKIKTNSIVNQPALENTDKLFIVQTYSSNDGGETDILRVGIFDPVNNKLVSYREVKTDPISVHSYNNGFSYFIFSPTKMELYFMTNGNTVIDNCGNEDACDMICPKTGECISARVYKININDSNPPEKIYDYIVNPPVYYVHEFSVPGVGSFSADENNSVSIDKLKSYEAIPSGSFFNIFINGIKKVFNTTLPIANYNALWAKDSNLLFYVARNGNQFNNQLRSINISTGEDQPIVDNIGYVYDSSYSGKYIAVQAEKWNKSDVISVERELIIYDLQNKSILNIPDQFKPIIHGGYDLVQWLK